MQMLRSVFSSICPASSSSLARLSGGSSFVSYPNGMTHLESAGKLDVSEVLTLVGLPVPWFFFSWADRSVEGEEWPGFTVSAAPGADRVSLRSVGPKRPPMGFPRNLDG